MMATQDCEPSAPAAGGAPGGSPGIFETQDCETFSHSQDLAEQARSRKSRLVERHELQRLEHTMAAMQRQL